MWIVKNVLKGTLLLEDLDVRIAPGDFFDLDTQARDKTEASNSLRVAFDEGYLHSVAKDGATQDGEGMRSRSPDSATAAAAQDDIAAQLAELKDMMRQGAAGAQPAQPVANLGSELKEAMSAMGRELADGLKGQFDRIASQRQAVAAEKAEIMSAADMSETEMKARMAMLDQKEAELTSNFDELEKKFGSQVEGDGTADAMASLLDNL